MAERPADSADCTITVYESHGHDPLIAVRVQAAVMAGGMGDTELAYELRRRAERLWAAADWVEDDG